MDSAWVNMAPTQYWVDFTHSLTHEYKTTQEKLPNSNLKHIVEWVNFYPVIF